MQIPRFVAAAVLAAALISRAADAPVPATPEPRHVNLIKLLDLSKDVRSGSWSLDNGSLSTPKAKIACIEFPYAPPAEYDYQIVFSAAEDKGQMSVLLAANHHQFGWMLGGWGGTIAGFHEINGKNADKNSTTKKSAQWITAGQDHTTLIKVRKDGVEAFLDGEHIAALQTDFSNMTLTKGERMNAGDSIGIDARFADYKIISAEVIEISGPGTAIRGSLAAAIPAPLPAPAAPSPAPSAALPAATLPTSDAATTAPVAVLKVPLNPTPEDARQLFAAGQYQDAQVAVTRVLAGPPGYDRTEMLMLRAECLIQSKQLLLGMQVLDGICQSAAKVADSKSAAKAGALLFVLKLSPGGVYTPQTTDDKTPINVIPPVTRKMAYEAVFTDQMALVQKRMHDADDATTIAPILDISNFFAGLKYLERENTGGTSKTGPIGKKLSGLAVKIINRSLDDDKKNVRRCSDDASQMVRVSESYTINSAGVTNNYHMVRRGLSHPEVVDLQDIDSACGRIVQTCNNFIFIFESHTDDLRSTAQRAGKIQERAEDVLAGHDDPGGDVYVHIP